MLWAGLLPKMNSHQVYGDTVTHVVQTLTASTMHTGFRDCTPGNDHQYKMSEGMDEHTSTSCEPVLAAPCRPKARLTSCCSEGADWAVHIGYRCAGCMALLSSYSSALS